MSNLLQDLRFAFRGLRKSPGFAVICVLTLALGIGANTAIFTLVDAVMLKSLPVANPSQLYRIGNATHCCVIGGRQGNWNIYSYDLYKQLRDHTPEFSEMAAFQGGLTDLSVRRSGSASVAEPAVGEFVSGNYFTMFGVQAFAGRTITPEDDTAGAVPVVVMSYRAWQKRYGLDPSLIGSTVTLNTVPYVVAGIAPPGFFGDSLRSDPADFWMPVNTEPILAGQNSSLNKQFHWLYVIGRLKPNAAATGIASELTVELQRWLAAQPDQSAHDREVQGKQHIEIVQAAGGVPDLQGRYKAGLQLLTTIAGLVLLIACANIANLLLARGAATRPETAIRVALGAPHWRLIRQTVTESVLLGILGGVAGLFVAFAGTRTILLLAFRGAQFVPISALPSLTVLGFAFFLSLVTGIVFGAAPAWITSHCDPAEALRGAGRGTQDISLLPRKTLVVMQVALSCILLIGAGLLSQTLRNLENQKFGFEPEGRMVVRVNPALAGYKPEKLYGLYQQLEQKLSRIPGVLSASYSIYSPMRDENWSFGISIQGHSPEERANASFDRVGPRYFETIGTRMLRGRPIGEADTPTSPQVAVINEAFARKYFPKQDPMGKHFGFGGMENSGDLEIVGIVEDAKYQDAREPAYETFFMPFLQITKDPKLSFMIGSHYVQDIELRVAGKQENLEPEVRRALAEIDPNLTVLQVLSLGEQVDRNFNQERLIARLTELFGLLALVLACVGLYGVTSYSVARRTGEIGIRMALGAGRGRVIGMVLRGAAVQLFAGLAIGIPIALACGRLVANQLYNVKSYDPLILGAVSLVLAVCAMFAGFIPARRAASIDPMQALRTD